jgi:AbrB family looped-hinge helix DNA binding protein
LIKLYILLNYNSNMSVNDNEILVKITSAGTISIPKQFRKYMDIQKGEYVKIILGKDRLLIRKVIISY